MGGFGFLYVQGLQMNAGREGAEVMGTEIHASVSGGRCFSLMCGLFSCMNGIPEVHRFQVLGAGHELLGQLHQ